MATEGPQDTGLAGRYATAVFELAQEQHALGAVEKDFADMKAAIAASPDLALLIRSPAYDAHDQAKAMAALADKMALSPIAKNFVQVLAAKRRLFALNDVIRSFESRIARERGEVQATVTSARPLGDSEMSELKTILKSKLGREPRIETKVDPSILGGLVVKVGSRMIDSSLRTKLVGIRAAMRGN